MNRMGLQVDIKKRMGDFSLEVSFHIGIETMALLGASGCGKSMTLKCIAGIETPDEGKIILDDRILFDSDKKINLPPRERRIGYLFQNYALFPNMTTEQNIGIGVNLPKAQKQKIVKEKMKAFYLEGLEKKKPHQLSGGQQQRVALARIIASEPDIIMLDEPFSALDSYLRWQLEQEMLEVIEAYQKPTLFVSHNRDEVYRICNRIGVMNTGKLEVDNEKKELFKNPKTISAALLTGCKNFSRIERINNHTVLALDWQVTLNTEAIVLDEVSYVGIRAHHIQVIKSDVDRVEIENIDSTDLSSDRSPENNNRMQCRVVREIENTFSMIIILENILLKKPEKSILGCTTSYSELRLEIGKKEWKEVKGTQIDIVLNKEYLLLVK